MVIHCRRERGLASPRCHPSIRTPGISVLSSLPTGVLPAFQIQLPLGSIVPWFPQGCLRAKRPGASGAALSPQAGAFCREGKARRRRLCRSLPATKAGGRGDACSPGCPSSAPRCLKRYNSHLHHTLKHRPSQSQVSTCQPPSNIIWVPRQILGTGPGLCPASPRAPRRLHARGRPGFPADACNGMASLLLFSLDWGRLLMEKQPKQHGRQVAQSRGQGGKPCQSNGSHPRHGTVEVAQNLRSRMVVWQSHDSVTKAMTKSV